MSNLLKIFLVILVIIVWFALYLPLSIVFYLFDLIITVFRLTFTTENPKNDLQRANSS